MSLFLMAGSKVLVLEKSNVTIETPGKTPSLFLKVGPHRHHLLLDPPIPHLRQTLDTALPRLHIVIGHCPHHYPTVRATHRNLAPEVHPLDLVPRKN